MANKLTKKMIDELRPKAERDAFLWCGELRGFGVRVKPSGVKTFLIQYRTEHGHTRRYSLGQHGRLTVDEARKQAKIKLAEVAQGRDPSTARKSARQIKTVAELCDAYLLDARAGRVLYRGRPKSSYTLDIDEGRIKRHIKPRLGRKPLDAVTRTDVERFMHDVMDGVTAVDVKTGPHGRARVTGGPGAAAKAVSLLSAIYTYAMRRRWVEANPCAGIEKPADNKRHRYLTADDYAKLGLALRTARAEGVNGAALDAIEALALTGCRKGEILKLTTAEIDPDGHCLRLKGTKTGPQMRPCGQVVLAFLRRASQGCNAWVFPSSRADQPIVNLRKPFLQVCAIAGLEHVTPHVLRHSYATTAHELGYSELTIAGLLGHSAGSVTARYAHHVDQALSAAADKVSTLIAERLRAGWLRPVSSVVIGPHRVVQVEC
jgi:integrase